MAASRSAVLNEWIGLSDFWHWGAGSQSSIAPTAGVDAFPFGLTSHLSISLRMREYGPAGSYVIPGGHAMFRSERLKSGGGEGGDDSGCSAMTSADEEPHLRHSGMPFSHRISNLEQVLLCQDIV